MTKIYYFSGTGNTLWSAKKIAGIIGQQCELFNIGMEIQPRTPVRQDRGSPLPKNEIVLEADAVVLLFPSYAFGMPVAVRRFVKKAVFKTPYVAAFGTHGTTPGGTLAALSRCLKKRFAGAVFFGRIPAVENYIAIFGPQEGEVVQKRTAMQSTATEEAACAITERRPCRVNTFRPFSAFVSLLFSLGIKIFYKFYQVSAECNGCGICEKVCPVANITLRENPLGDKRPVFFAKCEHCQACFNWCPKKAILFGRLNAVIPRYHHPAITLTDMANKINSPR
jgi:ferredoxin